MMFNTFVTKASKLSIAIGMIVSAVGFGETAKAMTFINPDNGHKYFLTDFGTWTEAQAEAVTEGGNLVTINDQAEQDWLVDVFGSSPAFWIGFTDEVTEGDFQWVSGQPVTYANWGIGEPNNANGVNEEDHAVINWTPAGFWNDLPVDFGPFQGIVEVETTSIPEPSSVMSLILFGAVGTGLLLKRK